MAKKAPAHFNLLDHLEKETKVKPFTAVIDAEGTEITFPNPMDMNWKDASRFMENMSSEDASVGEVFSEWLSTEDYEALENAEITMGQLMKLAEAVSAHYGAAFGTAGE